MPITQNVRQTARPGRQRIDDDTCLNCPECRGLCWSRIELSLVPDRVLLARRSTSA